MTYYQKVLDWSEVWALLIPLTILLFSRKPQPEMKPVIAYLLAALLLNFLIDFIGDYKKIFQFLPRSNTPLYNIHSVLRFACLGWFFLQKGERYYPKIQYFIIASFGVFLIVNFGFFEDFLDPDRINGNLFTTEAFLSLASCMVYYLAMLRNEQAFSFNGKDFWIVTGFSFYFVTTFFIFLFYDPMMDEKAKLANSLWDFHNYSYITLCIFITKAFYAAPRN